MIVRQIHVKMVEDVWISSIKLNAFVAKEQEEDFVKVCDDLIKD